MAVWLVRAGGLGESEDIALDNNVVVIGWPELGDLSRIQTREELDGLCRETFPDANRSKIANWVGQLWAFRERIEPGDLAVLPLKRRAAIAIGRVTGTYQYRPDLAQDARNTRSVEWLVKDLPRNSLEQDILYSLGAFMTVCKISRNNAEERIKAVLEGRPPPRAASSEGEAGEEGPRIDGEPPEDIDQFARDQILTFIGRRFRGHALATLVTAVLQAQGYKTEMSPPGADGGVDITAGRGPMGFDTPRLCVQVKSSDSPVDVRVLRELQGVMKNFGAEQGLLVAWGGFKDSVAKEARQRFFELRLWDSGDLVRALLEFYDQLPEDLQADLPLKKIWILVPEE
ncbi:MAG: restriction endonuclease [Dehalococcoidia bacterium]